MWWYILYDGRHLCGSTESTDIGVYLSNSKLDIVYITDHTRHSTMSQHT